jgi:YhgE/Pip-like protein
VATHRERSELHVRAVDILRVPRVWMFPLAIAAVFVALMSAIYIGAMVNPLQHLRNLPVVVVDEDSGATVNGQRLRLGDDVSTALTGTKAVAEKLQFTTGTLRQAHAKMDDADAYAAIVIPTTFTRSLLVTAGAEKASAQVPSGAQVTVLENVRLGSIGTGLVAGVTESAMAKISPAIGAKLTAMVKRQEQAQEQQAAAAAAAQAASGPAPSATQQAQTHAIQQAQEQAAQATVAALKNPISVATAQYRPLPADSALGLSAFYTALLAMMAGFIGATLIHSTVDSALGYGASEIGPRWRQRPPVRINRVRTFLLKWCIAVVAAPLLTGVQLLVSVAWLHMDAPHWPLLWALLALSTLMVSTGTLALMAAFGSLGQLLAMLIMIYLSLASSGGTVPVQALPGVFRVFSHVEPLRQIVDGTRAIMYFDARMTAGLSSSLLVISLSLVFWAIIGFGATAWYDHRRYYRIAPEILGYVEDTVANHALRGTAPQSTDTQSTDTQSTDTQSTDDEAPGGEPDAEPHVGGGR